MHMQRMRLSTRCSTLGLGPHGVAMKAWPWQPSPSVCASTALGSDPNPWCACTLALKTPQIWSRIWSRPLSMCTQSGSAQLLRNNS